MEKRNLYDMFADIVSYPSDPTLAVLRSDALKAMLDESPNRENRMASDRGTNLHSSAPSRESGESTGQEQGVENASLREHFASFIGATRALSCEEFEELYTRTFDINPVASLELGWHLYGEQYERGAFLVRMRGLLRQYEIEESTELPDHLTHALRLLGSIREDEAHLFAARYVLPAIVKMLEGFKEKQNPYEHLLLGIKMKIEQTFASGVLAHE